MQQHDSPPAIHVLVVDDDPLSLMVLERMLRRCHYQVTTCTRVAAALQLLRGHTETFDLVMSDVYMPDADGFKLLETVGLEMDLPVIMMSANGETSVVMKGITHGACDYLIKPIRMEELKTLWQHVVRRKGTKDAPMSTNSDSLVEETTLESMDMDIELPKYPVQNATEESMDEQFEGTLDELNSVSTTKKARVKWSAPLHEKFVHAVNEVGIDKAAPKKILEHMNVPGLTREHVASHLQKYRSTLKRLSGAPQQPVARDHVGSARMQPWQQQHAHIQHAMPAQASGLVRSSSIDPGWMDVSEKQMNPSVTEQKMVANRAQVLGGLGLQSSGPKPGTMITQSHPNKGGLLQRSAASGSFVSTSGNSLMGGAGGGGGLFRMGSLDIGLLLKMQQEEEEMEHLQKHGSRDDMDGFTASLSNSFGNVTKAMQAGGQPGQHSGRKPSRLSGGGGAGRPMIPMPAPPLGSMQQQTLASQRRKLGTSAATLTSAPSSNDVSANLNSNTIQGKNSSMQGSSRHFSGETSLEQSFPTWKYNNDMQMASPSSSSSTSLSNLSTSPTVAFSNSSPSSTISIDSFDGSAASYSEASSIFHNRVSPR